MISNLDSSGCTTNTGGDCLAGGIDAAAADYGKFFDYDCNSERPALCYLWGQCERVCV